jgi:drug/metabolite transporter (DMT)-like permease
VTFATAVKQRLAYLNAAVTSWTQSCTTLAMQRKSAERLALVALLAGATGIGFAPIFVRLSEVGPSATAFYRLFFALPVLWLAGSMESGRRATGLSDHQAPRPGSGITQALPGNGRLSGRSLAWCCGLAGVLFAGDLAFWHWSIKLTSVANSTLLTNCAPFFVLLGARLLFSERLTVLLVIGLAIASVGAALLVGASVQLSARHLLGDVLALVTASFYGGYLLTIKYLRRWLSTARTLALSGTVSCVLLLVIALASGESIRVASLRGWTVLVGLGLISHVGGQGLIAYALAHLPAGFSSVGLLLQPVVAAILAWLLLSEPLSLRQCIGGAVILAGVGLASQRRWAPAEDSA